ncbi:hypothetical protein DNX69_00590 [Rhodopseudomonas palustris]|jgi:hypothetical protein|uniref:Uncharacterized protein n=1 Tax=Rhodopseudomonas palustris TaxID=1076 RepID=A0A323V1E5_RHOPL|nr:hypothetical protein [Rhodopseudomonas palustris]PZA13958.1 hypothetical protein DNX69_00590 [Rhodopseudomonas palustris]
MAKQPLPAKPEPEATVETPAVKIETPEVKIEEGTADAAALNVIAEPKKVSTDTFGNQIEER